MMDRVGQRFGNYRLLRLIGRGGFANVYLGEHVYIGTQAAIKVLHTQLGNKEMELFQAEARMIARLEHPHIVRTLDFGIEETTPFLVLSYAPHGTLRERHPKGSMLPLLTISNYVQQVADALQYAHQENIIHRDIKPENMLVGPHQEILLSDFGIALVSQSSRYQSVKDLAGTALYMAPEQIEARPQPASDQYALGVVVYEWLCGSCPFQGTFTETALKHTTTPPPSLRAQIPDLPLAVEQVVMMALAKDPARRFASVKAFARALEQAIRMTIPAGTMAGDTQIIPPVEGNTGPIPLGEEMMWAATPPVWPVTPQSGPVPIPPVPPAVPVDERPISGQGSSGQHFYDMPPVASPPPPNLTPPPSVAPNLTPQISFTPRTMEQASPSISGRQMATGGIPRVVGIQSSGNTSNASDYPPPLRSSKKWLILLIGLAVLVIGGSVFGALYVFQRPQNKPLRALTPTPTVANFQVGHRDALNAYNQAAAAHGMMFGYGPQHTRANPYEAILGKDNLPQKTPAWTAPTGSTFYYSSPVMANDTVYIGSHDGKLYAFDAYSGAQKWVGVTNGQIDSSPAVADGLVYVGSADHNLYAFDAKTGHFKWKAPTQGQIFSSPTVVDGAVYVGSRDAKLYAFDAVNGHLEWAVSTEFLTTYSSPAVANGLVYIGSNNGKLYAFDTTTGDMKWSKQAGNLITSSPAIANGVVYVGSNNGTLYAFEASTGKFKWSRSTGAAIFSSPAVNNGVVYVGSNDKMLYAFEASTGKPKWLKSTGDEIESSPIWANGLVYVGSWDGNVYAFDATTGQKKWVASTGSRIYSSPMVANGVVYISNISGKLYAFQPAS